MYVANKAAQILGKPLGETNLVTCHIGNGASCAAILNGKVVDTRYSIAICEGGWVQVGSGAERRDAKMSVRDLLTYIETNNILLTPTWPSPPPSPTTPSSPDPAWA